MPNSALIRRVVDLPRSSLRTGLVAYWRLDEASGTRFDSSGNGNHLTSVNGVGQAAGVIGNAASFVGPSSQYLSIASNPSLQVSRGSFSIVGWFFPISGTGTFPVISKDSGTNNTIEFEVTEASSTGHVMFTMGSGSGFASVTWLGIASFGHWQFLAARYDAVAKVMRLKVQNLNEVTTPFDNLGFSGTGVLRIAHDGVENTYFTMRADGLGLWNRYVSDLEVDSLFNSGNGRTLP